MSQRKTGPRARKTVVASDRFRVKELRVQAKWTQEDLAIQAGVGKISVQRFETDTPIEVQNALLIEEALKKRLGANTVGQLFKQSEDTEFEIATQQWMETNSNPIQQLVRAGRPHRGKYPGNLWFDVSAKTLWGMRPTIFLPIEAKDLDFVGGKLRKFEVPRVVLESIASAKPELLMGFKVYEYLRDVWSHPKKYHSIISGYPPLKEWVDAIWAPVPKAAELLERHNLQNFFCAMQKRDPDVRCLPTCTFDDVSCWRIFVQMFPESICLLEMVGKNKSMPTSIRMAISLLSSTLATTDEGWISIRARALADRLREEVAGSAVRNFQQYKLVRQFLFAAVEAGEFPVGTMLDFLHRYASTGWELRHNREYYADPTDVSFTLGTIRKCARPLLRDQMTLTIQEYYLNELLPKKLVEHFRDQYRLFPSQN
jgi:transcriptional regulator with XRE-family HTH domain